LVNVCEIVNGNNQYNCFEWCHQPIPLRLEVELLVTIQQHPICTRSDSPAYKCIEVCAYLLIGLLEHSWSTAKQLHSRVFASFSVDT